jgi:hypothetical protein
MDGKVWGREYEKVRTLRIPGVGRRRGGLAGVRIFNYLGLR